MYFYFTKNFRKVIEIDNSANESTRTHFYDYKMINNVKTYTKMRIEKEDRDRIHRLNQQDNQAFNVYEQIHNRLINK